MFIQTEPTPNPATLKFIPGKTVLGDGTVDYRAKAEADRLAAGAAPVRRRRRDRRVPGLRLHLRDQGRRRRVAAHQAGHPRRHHGALHVGRAGDRTTVRRRARTQPSDYDPKDEETVKTIKELLDTRVRPAVANDGGDIIFHGFKDGVVYLHMRGACAGCPSSTATLRHGIENLLKHFCPDVQEVRPV